MTKKCVTQRNNTLQGSQPLILQFDPFICFQNSCNPAEVRSPYISNLSEDPRCVIYLRSLSLLVSFYLHYVNPQLLCSVCPDHQHCRHGGQRSKVIVVCLESF